jgi:hypothetical protein
MGRERQRKRGGWLHKNGTITKGLNSQPNFIKKQQQQKKDKQTNKGWEDGNLPSSLCWHYHVLPIKA